MLLFQYIDNLPKIPDHLITNPAILDESKIGFHVRDAGYIRWAANEDLSDWLEKNISQNIKLAGVQTMSKTVPAHCDKRLWAVNYILKTGGSGVTTTFYQEVGQPILREPATRVQENAKLDVIDQVIIEPFRWHILSTVVLHGVENIESQRQAVTLGLNSTDPFSELKCENI